VPLHSSSSVVPLAVSEHLLPRRWRLRGPVSPRSRGQALVEFALVLPVLVLLLALAVDFGRVFFGWIALNNAARIGASFAAERPEAWPADNALDTAAQASFRQAVANDLNTINCDPPGGGTDWVEADVPDPSFPDGQDVGDDAVLSLTCNFSLVTPIASNLIGGTLEVDTEATFAIHLGNRQALPTPAIFPTPTPTPALNTPTPAPTNCTVPQTVGGNRNAAQNLWDAAGFVAGNLVRNGNGNFTVAHQTLTAGSSVPCNATMTITEAGQPTPSPTPVPTATPVPTPTPLATPTPVPTPSPTPCPAPVASFTFSPAQPSRQTTVQFTSTSTSGCAITTYAWNFGNGQTSSAQNPTQRFNFGGTANSQTFTVSLTVTSAGGSSTSTQEITVTR
jgi:hypothetical protein